VVTVPPAPAVEDLSATDLRNALENEDFEAMKKFMPEDLIEDYLNILIGD
jgi:predicted nucleotidyltransferase